MSTICVMSLTSKSLKTFTRNNDNINVFRALSIILLPFLLASGYTRTAVGSVGGQLGRLHATQLSSVPIPCLGAGPWMDHCLTVTLVHTSVCCSHGD